MKHESLLDRTKAFITLGLSAGLLIGHPVSAGSSLPYYEIPATKTPAKKTKFKTNFSRNNNAVKIYPDVFTRSMHVVAKYNEGREIDFFVLDMEGTLMQNFKMKQKDHQKITGLEKGRYQYRVFDGDEETANGYFEIR